MQPRPPDPEGPYPLGTAPANFTRQGSVIQHDPDAVFMSWLGIEFKTSDPYELWADILQQPDAPHNALSLATYGRFRQACADLTDRRLSPHSQVDSVQSSLMLLMTAEEMLRKATLACENGQAAEVPGQELGVGATVFFKLQLLSCITRLLELRLRYIAENGMGQQEVERAATLALIEWVRLGIFRTTATNNKELQSYNPAQPQVTATRAEIWDMWNLRVAGVHKYGHPGDPENTGGQPSFDDAEAAAAAAAADSTTDDDGGGGSVTDDDGDDEGDDE